jgi:hypothetical protein
MLGHRIIVPADDREAPRGYSEGRHCRLIEISRIEPDAAGGEAANFGYRLPCLAAWTPARARDGVPAPVPFRTERLLGVVVDWSSVWPDR